MSEPRDIFDPAHYERVRLPVLEAESLPPWCYTSPAFYEREVERIFRRGWQFVGRADELPEPGDFLTFELVGEPVIVVRGRDGRLRAFVNSCRHRGSRLLEGSGNCRVISCPYHAWAYSLTGELVATPGMERTLGFERADYGLPELPLECWEGFLFVSFEAAPPPLADWLGNLPETLASYGFSEMVCVRRKAYDLACNWKIYVENAMEDYHTPTVHKKSIGKQVSSQIESRGQWDGIHMPAERTIAVLPEDREHAFPPIPGLQGLAASGTHFVVLYPCTFFAVTQDCMWWLQEFPLGPERTRIVIGSCFPKTTVARPDFAAKAEKYYRRWDKALPEDNWISEMQQAGLRSAFSRPGRLSFHEPIVRDIANWVVGRVID